MFKYQVDEDIYLAILEMRHAEPLYQLVVANRDHIGQFLPFAYRTHRLEDTRIYIESSLRDFASGVGVNTGIWYQEELVGTIGLHIDATNQSASVGYWISERHEGLGIVTKSCRALMAYAFNELKLHRVEIRANLDNAKSRAIPERLGFTHEGILRGAFNRYDTYHDSVVYGMLVDEWDAARLF